MLSVAGVLIATIVLVPLSIPLLRRINVVDVPSVRSSHARPTLRGGGLAPAFVVLVAVGLTPGLHGHARASVLMGGGLFALLGLADDLRDVHPLPRFLGQLAAAALAIPWLLGNVQLPPATIGLLAVLALFWIVSYVNSFNFMDGINGISAAQAVAAGGAFGIVGIWTGAYTVAVLGGATATAALGFLPFNFPRARVFLGDVGSYFFGALLALLVLLALRAGFPLEAAFAPLVLYLADTGTTLLRRMFKGEPWHQPHRDHVYQRLVKLGWSHTQVTGVIFLAILFCGALGALTVAAPGARQIAVPAIAAIVGIYLLLPRLHLRLSPSPSRG